eukprot:9494328-Pyramimonas_sp.AAC.1
MTNKGSTDSLSSSALIGRCRKVGGRFKLSGGEDDRVHTAGRRSHPSSPTLCHRVQVSARPLLSPLYQDRGNNDN